MEHYLILLVVDYLNYLLIRCHWLVKGRVLYVFEGMFEIFDPFGVGLVVFESDSDRTFLLAGEGNVEVEEVTAHQPTLLLYLLHICDRTQVYFVLHFLLYRLYGQLLLERIQSHISRFQSFSKRRYLKHITFCYSRHSYFENTQFLAKKQGYLLVSADLHWFLTFPVYHLQICFVFEQQLHSFRVRQ